MAYWPLKPNTHAGNIHANTSLGVVQNLLYYVCFHCSLGPTAEISFHFLLHIRKSENLRWEIPSDTVIT